MVEFNLSEKRFKQYTGDTIQGCEEWYYQYHQYDVKEFIRLLKEEFNKDCTDYQDIMKIIDKLAGDKLNGN